MSAACRTADEAFAAGWADGETDKPMTREEIEQLATLHAPYLTPQAEAS